MFCVNHAKRSASPSAPRSRHAFRIERQQETNYGLAKMISPTHSFFCYYKKKRRARSPCTATRPCCLYRPMCRARQKLAVNSTNRELNAEPPIEPAYASKLSLTLRLEAG